LAPLLAHASAEADSSVKPHAVVKDSNLREWLADPLGWILLANFDYESFKEADGEEPDPNPEFWGVDDKFKAGPTGRKWPDWQRFFQAAGWPGSDAKTTARGTSHVIPLSTGWDAYDAKIHATAIVNRHPWEGSGKAISTIHDPWTVSFDDTGSPDLRNLLGVTIAIGGSMQPGAGGPSATWTTYTGDFGTLSMGIDSVTGEFTPEVILDPAWKAYLNVDFPESESNMSVPPEVSAADIASALSAAYDPITGSWSADGSGLRVTFMKDVGSIASVQTLSVDMSVEDRADAGMPSANFANGSYRTGFGDGYSGADTSTVEAPSNYFGWTVAAGQYHLADDFTVPPAEDWGLGELIWPAYQTSADPADFIVAAYVRIYDHTPMTGSTPLFGDLTTNRIINSVFSDTYRCLESDPLSNLRAIKDVTIDMSWVPLLPPGTYWIEVAMIGNPGFSGPFSAPNTPRTTDENARQLDVATGEWSPIVDTGTGEGVDFPFVLRSINGGSEPMMLQSSKLAANQVANITCWGTTPGRRVYLIYSLSGNGTEYIPQLDVIADLGNPTLVGWQLADSDGKATFSVPLSSSIPTPLPVWIQALERNRKSNVVTRTVYGE